MPNRKEHFSNLFDEANQAWDAGHLKRAFELFLTAAHRGEEHAFNSVGFFFDHGIGVKKNSASAYAWYRRAALRGDLAGCLNLGLWYREEGNLRRSKFWYEKAYLQGDGAAAFELGKIYLLHHSSTSVRKHAREYLSKAATSKYISEDERKEAKYCFPR